MKSGVIIYESKYGATGQYANWLSQTLQIPAMHVKDLNPASLSQYDLLILGTPVYIGKLRIRKWLQQQMKALAGKKVVLFIVCGTSNAEPVEQSRIIQSNLPADFSASTKIFFLPGRCLVEQVSWIDKLLLQFGAMMQKDPKIKAAMKQGFDNMDRNSLGPLLTAVKE